MAVTKENTSEPQINNVSAEEKRIRLQCIKEDLIEATTKVLWYSIEMYTKRNFIEWVKSADGLLGLADELDELGDILKAKSGVLKKGNYEILDITNSLFVINKCVKDNAYKVTLNALREEIELEKSKKDKIEKEIEHIKQKLREKKEEKDILNKKEKEEDKKKLEKRLDVLENAKNDLSRQKKNEERRLDSLREFRNDEYAHNVVVEKDISQLGSWVVEISSLYTWIRAIERYLDAIDVRYVLYQKFDEFYKSVDGNNRVKNEFDACRNFVERQKGILDQFGECIMRLIK